MTFPELFLTAVGLSMDAFAAAICIGLAMPKATLKKSAVVGLYFGGFQGAMPLAGFLLGHQFANKIIAYDHWIAFVLLGLIGGNMIRESLSADGCCGCEEDPSLGPRRMLPLAVATSIDALAAGVSFAFLDVDILPAVSFIAAATFLLSAAGVKVGNTFGARYKSKAELAGGVILISMGLKILLEHLGILQ